SGKNIIRWLLKKRTNGSVRYCQYTSDATRVQGLFQHLQVRFGDGPWQDVKGLDEVGSDTGRTGE
ncbi:phage tail fiber C-terminal domain-containing protein, partial [Escherichia coli]|uniref:phage tail fiber C-terminal domain-containing protein n=1 Tax=Escherichia coli TaxID=562 RepID=UPI00201B1C90